MLEAATISNTAGIINCFGPRACTPHRRHRTMISPCWYASHSSHNVVDGSGLSTPATIQPKPGYDALRRTDRATSDRPACVGGSIDRIHAFGLRASQCYCNDRAPNPPERLSASNTYRVPRMPVRTCPPCVEGPSSVVHYNPGVRLYTHLLDNNVVDQERSH